MLGIQMSNPQLWRRKAAYSCPFPFEQSRQQKHCIQESERFKLLSFLLFSVDNIFSKGKYSIQLSLALKLSMTPRLYCRAVSTLINTNVWASPGLGSPRWRVGIPLSAIFFYSTYFKILVSPFLFFNTR